MREFLGFVILGLGTGGLYAIAAQGLVVIHRASGIVNFAQGGFATLGGYAFFELSTAGGVPVVPAILLAVMLGGVIGGGTYGLILRPIRAAAPVTKIVATLGMAVVIQSIVVLRYQQDTSSVETFLPTSVVNISGVNVGADRLLLLGIGAVMSALLWAIYRYTQFGRLTSATAENEHALETLGRRPDRIAAANWVVGSALGALAGVLLAPITFLQPTQFGLLIVPVAAAAALGGFSSFPLAFVGALAIGVAQSLVGKYVDLPGASDATPLVLVILLLVFRGHALPQRGYVFDRLAAVGSGRVRPVPVAIICAVSALFILTVMPLEWAVPLAVTLGGACLCISVVVVTGYAGQLSLAQLVLGGLGAFIAAKLVSAQDVPFLVAMLAAVAASTAIGGLVALPALRTRGINLAICTLGLAVAGYKMILDSEKFDGGLAGIPVSAPSLLGWDMDPMLYPRRFTLFAFVLLILVALAVANLRRGSSGRRLLAVRSNERAAAALGVSVAGAKLYAFMLGAAIAAIGGCLIAFLQSAILFSSFDVFSSIGLVTATVVGGVGGVGGGLLGSLLLPNGIMSEIFGGIDNINAWLPLIGGASVLFAVRFAPDGLFEMHRLMFVQAWSAARHRGDGQKPVAAPAPVSAGEASSVTVRPAALTIRGLSVRYGGVVAVRDMELTVKPGTVHGLIGPNGAGKTTLIDAITGFTASTSTVMEMDGEPISDWSPQRRARHGISRSFQAGELFNDLSVRENVAVACDDRRLRRFVTDLARPGRVRLTPAAERAVHEFELGEALDDSPLALPFGRRRLVGIARAVAGSPSVLLLDEPAAGLDSGEAEELAALIKVLAHDWGIAVLLVEHNIDMVLSVADEMTVMVGGAPLLCSVPPQDAIADPRVLEAYLGSSETDAGQPSDPVTVHNGAGDAR